MASLRRKGYAAILHAVRGGIEDFFAGNDLTSSITRRVRTSFSSLNIRNVKALFKKDALEKDIVRIKVTPEQVIETNKTLLKIKEELGEDAFQFAVDSVPLGEVFSYFMGDPNHGKRSGHDLKRKSFSITRAFQEVLAGAVGDVMQSLNPDEVLTFIVYMLTNGKGYEDGEKYFSDLDGHYSERLVAMTKLRFV